MIGTGNESGNESDNESDNDPSSGTDGTDAIEGDDSSEEAMAAGHQVAPEDGTVTTAGGERVPEPEGGGDSSDAAVAEHRETIEKLADSPHRGDQAGVGRAGPPNDESTLPPATVRPERSPEDRPNPS